MNTITHRAGDYYGDGIPALIWEIRDEDGIAAELYIDPTHRMITQLEVRADRQGEGLARALHAAADADGGVFHAPEWACTPEGLAFAQAVGGEVMDDETAAAITGFDLDLLAA